MYNIIIGFGIPMKLVMLIKMCVNETCSRVSVGKNLSGMFAIRNGLKKGDALSSLLFVFALEYIIRRFQVNQDDLKLNSTCQFPVYDDDVNIVEGSVHTIKENTEALIVASKETEPEINADNTKHMVVSRDQNAGQRHNMRIDNRSFERVEDFKYLGKNLKNQNSIQEEIKSRLKTGNACYYSVQNLMSSYLLSKSIKTHRTIILPVVLYG